MKETLFNEPQELALPDKSEILHLAENIGDVAIPPTPDELQRAMRMLLELSDECYRQREEIARLKAKNAELRKRLTVDHAMVDRFIAAKMPYPLCSDGCCTGTNLLTADQARWALDAALGGEL